MTTPAGVICAILLPKNSVNQRLPSRPAVMAKGPLSLMRSEANSVITPAEVIRPMTPETSANQILPSGPTVMPRGLPVMPLGLPAVRT